MPSSLAGARAKGAHTRASRPFIANGNAICLIRSHQSGVKTVPSFIPKQPKKERNQITIRLDQHVLESLERYCRYLDSSRDYVINQCLVFIFRKDRHFTEWVETNPQLANGSTAKLVTK